MRVEWGIGGRTVLRGAQLSVRIFQIASLLPLPYLFAIAGYPAVITTRNAFTLLFETGVMAIPRLEALAISFLYRASANEVAVYFALLVSALALGMILEKLLVDERTALATRRVLAVLIAADLAFRLPPVGFNLAFGLPAALLGSLCQAACLAFVLLDLRAVHNTQRKTAR